MLSKVKNIMGGHGIRCLSSVGVRVRFAPSPTGLLHLGGYRTALINYLFALKHGGKFILRIEDTDQTRLVEGAVDMIQKDLDWLQISTNEGPLNSGPYGPYIQSQRLQLYRSNLEHLIEMGHAYECFCSETRLDLIRREAMRLRQIPRYDNKCKELSREQVKGKKAIGEKFTVRFKMNKEIVKLYDLVHGSVEFDLNKFFEGDPIIMKSDGYPTYHFANVVDDHLMEITHVFRGIEWQVSTPKHLQMYRAFNWKAPEYGHLPNVVNKDGTKLSKRQGDVSMKHYREMLYYPKAIANFVTKSGGGFSDHNVNKIYSLEELAELFEMSAVNTSACRLDFELLSKLNQLELSNEIRTNLVGTIATLSQLLQTSNSNQKDFSDEYLRKVLSWCPHRITSLRELISPEYAYLWTIPNAKSALKVSSSTSLLLKFTAELETYLSNCHDEKVLKTGISTFIKNFAASNFISFKVLMADLRLLLCGLEKGPPIADLVALFGNQECFSRLKRGIEQIPNDIKSQNLSS